jgi:FAD/FMN-containing dehydrogenase
VTNRAHKRIRYPKYMPPAVETPTTNAAPDTTPVKPPFESWGRYPVYDADVRSIHWQDQFPRVIDGVHHGALPVGMGRSYGDVCLLKDGTLVRTTGMNRLLGFDPATGVLTAEAGITLAQILDFAVPRGFFLPVSPGTKYVTLGGAIANDIHGKNHHIAGTFGCHVPQFELVRSDGTHLRCSPAENPDMYSATIGGLGLTGMITWAQLRLKRIVSRKIDYQGIQFHGIDEFLDLTAQSQNIEYTVSWIDVTSTGKNFARGVFMQGDHSQIPNELKTSSEPKLVFPIELPGWVLNGASVGAFNTLFFNKQMKQRVSALQDYEPFFYPLDAVLKWNKMYGKRGLLQFQYAIPWEHAREGTIAILQEVAKSGLASFLAVLKAFGDVPSPGMMSFPKPGITLALDFPIKPEKSFALFDRLAEMTNEFGGRLYPAKDARMTAPQFQAFYPQWQRFARFKDPALTSSFWERVVGGQGFMR